MLNDPSAITLTPEQKARLASIAERTGKDYSAVVDELLSTISLPDADTGNENGPQNLLEALEAVGAIGCIDGPADLSTNPKYMEGFGVNASRRNSD